MTNIITFSFKSDAPWSEDELDNLNEELAASVKEMDDDHVPGSFEITFADESEAASQEAKIRAAAISMIENGLLSATVIIQDEDGDEITSIDLSEK